jgi:hypothetical protein
MCPGFYETFFIVTPFAVLAGFITGVCGALVLAVKYWDS